MFIECNPSSALNPYLDLVNVGVVIVVGWSVPVAGADVGRLRQPLVLARLRAQVLGPRHQVVPLCGVLWLLQDGLGGRVGEGADQPHLELSRLNELSHLRDLSHFRDKSS